MNESEFWTRRVRPIIYGNPYAMAERVENGIASGTPDAHFCIERVAGWIENKFRKDAPKHETTVVFGHKGLRREQLVWWTVYLRAGGHGFVAVGIGEEGYLIPATLRTIPLFNQMTLHEMRRFPELKTLTYQAFTRRATP